MRIGILGGTFNPIHSGHLILAENAYEQLQLDKILFIPSGVSYLKDQDEIVSANHRVTMTMLAINDNHHFEYSDIEIKRKGNTYTYETLAELKEMHPEYELYFIGGADLLSQIPSWMKPEEIFEMATLVIAPRLPYDKDEMHRLTDELTNRFNARIILLDVPNIDISSSMIRDRIKNQQFIRYYVPKDVEVYIYKHKLYRK